MKFPDIGIISAAVKKKENSNKVFMSHKLVNFCRWVFYSQTF